MWKYSGYQRNVYLQNTSKNNILYHNIVLNHAILHALCIIEQDCPHNLVQNASQHQDFLTFPKETFYETLNAQETYLLVITDLTQVIKIISSALALCYCQCYGFIIHFLLHSAGKIIVLLKAVHHIIGPLAYSGITIFVSFTVIFLLHLFYHYLPHRYVHHNHNFYCISLLSLSLLQASNTTSRRPSDYDLLTLDHVSSMTENLLLKLFAEFESNEMWKRFTYTCGMLPAACSKYFQSFGSEHKARSGMKAHLQTHLKSLLEVHKSKSMMPVVFTLMNVCFIYANQERCKVNK